MTEIEPVPKPPEPDLGADIRKLTLEVQRLGARFKWARISIVLLIVVTVGLCYFGWRTAATTNCTTSWANATANRANAVTPASTARIDDLYKYILDAAAGVTLTDAQRGAIVAELGRHRAQFPKIIPADIATETDTQLASTFDIVRGLLDNGTYEDAATAHPIPPAPAAHCNFWI